MDECDRRLPHVAENSSDGWSRRAIPATGEDGPAQGDPLNGESASWVVL